MINTENPCICINTYVNIYIYLFTKISIDIDHIFPCIYILNMNISKTYRVYIVCVCSRKGCPNQGTRVHVEPREPAGLERVSPSHCSLCRSFQFRISEREGEFRPYTVGPMVELPTPRVKYHHPFLFRPYGL